MTSTFRALPAHRVGPPLTADASTLNTALPGAGIQLPRALQIVRRSLTVVAFFTFFINLLALTGSVYMLQIYDRVLASRNLATLTYLTLFAVGCLATLAVLEVVRSRLLVRMGVRFDAHLSEGVFRHTLLQGRSSLALKDVEQLRTFLSGPTMLALLDLPWMPLYIALVYLMHPWLGHVALSGGIVLVLLGLWNEQCTRLPLREAGHALGGSARQAELAGRNAEVVAALGMTDALARIWRRRQEVGLGLQGLASDRGANVSAVAKAFRMFLQVAILGVGAWLVILQQTTAGVMIAASIVMGRALAPLEASIGAWRGVQAAREAYQRLATLASVGFGKHGQAPGPASPKAEPMPLPRPEGHLAFSAVNAAPPGSQRLTVQQMSFSLAAGTCLGVTGPSGSGKSSLARLAIGVWRPMSGSVTLDGARVADWPRERLGPWVGYLPQDIELFAGTVAENIARFGEQDAEAIVAAAELAGAHTMILSLPKGYDTPIGFDGANLSGGQRQRIGLARALYGDPPLVVLDEPTAHLDAEGEAAVRQALGVLKSRHQTVLVVAHRPAVLAGTDQLMIVVDGRIANMAPTSELMPQITRRASGNPMPIDGDQAGSERHG